MVWVQGSRIRGVVQNSKVADLTHECIVVLITVIVYAQLIKLFGENWERVVLRMDAYDFDLLYEKLD